MTGGGKDTRDEVEGAGDRRRALETYIKEGEVEGDCSRRRSKKREDGRKRWSGGYRWTVWTSKAAHPAEVQRLTA